MEKKYTVLDLRLCWDYFVDGHYGLEGNPKSFDEWLVAIGADENPALRICESCGCSDGVHKSNCSFMAKI